MASKGEGTMPGREAKFCIDRNQVRWVLLEGVINRKTPQDDPDKGLNLPVEQITAIEKTQVKKRHKNPLAKPAAAAGLLLLALFGWLATLSLWLGVPGLVAGLYALIWGLMRLPGTTETLDAYQIVAAGTHPEDWYIVGSHPEVEGFIAGLRRELEHLRNQQAALKH
ncbi:MAG TPA: hypothetical protein VNN17_00385 [Terriglobia bacterium]|nr:hypothetical protein [Terriglobia bacterium]